MLFVSMLERHSHRGPDGGQARHPRHVKPRALLWAPILVAGLWSCTEGPAADPRPPSVLLIVVDTLRADHLGLYGYERPTSPNLDALGRTGVVFERAQSASSWTLPSMATLLTGVLPSRHGCGVARGEAQERESLRAHLEGLETSFLGLHESVPTLAEAFARNGFWTAAIVTNNFLKPAFGMKRGFEFYRARFPMDADEAVDAVLAAFAQRPDAPYFALVHFMDPHLPYGAGEGFRGMFTRDVPSDMELPVKEIRRLRRTASRISDSERAFITAAYDEEIAGVDAEIGRMLDALRAAGELDNTFVVLTSDHGEELFEHGGFEHGHSMYQELLHVPLIVFGPGLEARRVEDVVSLLDVAATLCELAGLSAPEIGGSSLEPLVRGGGRGPAVAYSEGTLYGEDQRALLSWPLKLTARPSTGASAFDLEGDPGERLPLPVGGALENLLSAMDERLRQEAALRESAPAAEIDPETQEQLKQLGYTGD